MVQIKTIIIKSNINYANDINLRNTLGSWYNIIKFKRKKEKKRNCLCTFFDVKNYTHLHLRNLSTYYLLLMSETKTK